MATHRIFYAVFQVTKPGLYRKDPVECVILADGDGPGISGIITPSIPLEPGERLDVVKLTDEAGVDLEISSVKAWTAPVGSEAVSVVQ